MKDRGSSAMSDTHEEDKIFAAVPILGLTSQEVAERVASGDVNADVGAKTRSVSEIVRDNVCTLFNLVNVILAAFVFVTGSFKNMLFMMVIVTP